MGIYHKIGVKAVAKDVINALTTKTGLANWWTKDVSGNFFSGISAVGDLISFGFGHGNAIEMKVQDITANHVLWECISGPEDWIGSHIDFHLNMGKAATGEELTILYFRHKDWKKESEFTAHCSMKWATFLLSLKNLIEIGVGKPSPDDIKIDDIN
ncbi:SRPBCC domain-containing protein [Leptospira sp. 85282-16]|uniref:SRPBCC domain-containing protein n=1 Tax=Leptospira montravelensis TaxID=2484961 RepID=A0ABY2LQN1_9LEPT|nr:MULTISPECIES: SRPBCC domain-containing protein [Leptospira]MCT8335071.1 SRPBCC domain-containing protein [Leptospira sp. 85282-16]TGK78681.1 SRPBCC domain-containing protein [Leptospira montravelensis]TGL02385.1 SRPBCC domain-containing protein [Leptospira montravelensis]